MLCCVAATLRVDHDPCEMTRFGGVRFLVLSLASALCHHYYLHSCCCYCDAFLKFAQKRRSKLVKRESIDFDSMETFIRNNKLEFTGILSWITGCVDGLRRWRCRLSKTIEISVKKLNSLSYLIGKFEKSSFDQMKIVECNVNELPLDRCLWLGPVCWALVTLDRVYLLRSIGCRCVDLHAIGCYMEISRTS